MGVIIAPSLQIYDKSIWARFSELCLAQSKQNISVNYYPVQFSSVAQSCPTLCDPMNCSISILSHSFGFSFLYKLLKCPPSHVKKEKNTNIYFNAWLNRWNAK